MFRPFATVPAYEHHESLWANVAFGVLWECEAGSDLVRWAGNVESLFGYERHEVEERLDWWTARAHPEDLDRVQAIATQAIRSGAPGWVGEFRFRRKDGAWAWLAARCAIERDALGRAHRLIGAMIDVTKLREAEARLHVFTRQIPARATATDRELRVLWDTGAAFSATASVVGKTVVELFETSPDRDRVLEACRRALDGESSVLDLDDGTAAARLHLGPFCDPAGDVTGVVGVAFDITERVRAEDALRHLSRRLIEAQETERRAIARELHDDLGQVLTGLRINLLRRHGDDAESLALVDGALARLRGLAQQLRPALLDELGLEAALRWYVDREAKRAGLETILTVAPRDPRPPVTVEVAVFRIVQEALTNVIRHASARCVTISVDYTDDALHLVVRDDGRGFDVMAARKRAATGASQGLINMHERVALAGGELRIDSFPGKGTSVAVRVPLVA